VRSYRQFHSALEQHAFTFPGDFDQYAFNEYVEAVGHLVDVLDLFDRDHRDFLNVFTDGSLTKAEKRIRIATYTTPQNYVRANQLETPFQRHFLGKIRSQIPQSLAGSQISETRGVALLNVVIAARSIDGIIFDWGVQFQGNTVKLNCYAREYATSKFEQLPPKIRDEFRALGAERHLRGPNLGRKRAYVSLSKKLGFSWTDAFAKIVEAHALAYSELSTLGRSMATGHGVEAALPLSPSAPIQD
jgi:hypothetical protein